MSAGLVLNGRFRLIEELGRGGMGTVWRAEDLVLEAPAAVKLIDPQFVQSPEALARFRREAKAAAAIRSTHVVQILEYGVENEVPYIAMELMKGETLAQRLQQVGRLTPQLTLTVLTHVGRALSVAHEHGIIHRDLKPDNVFLVHEMGEDVGKVLDFGIARQLGPLGDSSGFQTQSGAVLGTPYYMSPEHTMGQFVDHRADIWSFGVIAYECLTGALPFNHESLGGLVRAICVAPPPVPSQVTPVPAGFDAWFAKATARDPSDRFQAVNDAVTDLRAICRNESIRSIPMTSATLREQPEASLHTQSLDTTAPPVQPTSPGWRKPRARLAVLLGTGSLVLVVAGIQWGLHKANHTQATIAANEPVSPTPVASQAAVVAGPTKMDPTIADAGAVPSQESKALASNPIAPITPSAALPVQPPTHAARIPSRHPMKPSVTPSKKPANVAGF